MADDKATTKYCPSCGEHVILYAVRVGHGVELRCTLCGIPLATRPPEDHTSRTLHGL